MAPGKARRSGPAMELLTPSQPAWDDRLAVARRDIYHLAGYHAYAEGSGEGEPMPITVGDRERGLAWPYLLRRIDAMEGLAGTDATDVTSVYGYPGPIAWGCRPGDPFLAGAWQEILEVWRQQRVVSASSSFDPLLGNAAIVAELPPPADRAGMPLPLVPGGPTVSIDCRMDDGAARRGYAKVLRQEIDAARRAGLVTEVDEDWSEIETFTRLYGETMVRSGAGAEYTLGLSDVRRLRAALGGRLHLLVTHWKKPSPPCVCSLNWTASSRPIWLGQTRTCGTCRLSRSFWTTPAHGLGAAGITCSISGADGPGTRIRCSPSRRTSPPTATPFTPAGGFSSRGSTASSSRRAGARWALATRRGRDTSPPIGLGRPPRQPGRTVI